jgi:hypothetical protein
MKSPVLLFTLAAVALAGCNSDLAGDRDRTTSSTSSGAGGAGTGSSSTSTSTTTMGTGGSGTGGTFGMPTASDLKGRCQQSKIAPPMLRRLTRTELENSILDVFPQIAPMYTGVKLGPDALSTLKFSNDASVLVVGGETVKEVLKTAKDVAALVTSSTYLPSILPCSTGAADQACATTFVNTFGPRLYRHALSDDEKNELVSYYASVAGRSNFTMGLKWTLTTMLQAPDFLYRSEIGDAAGKLSPEEIATELSYTFGGTTPSAALMSKASSGALSSPDVLAQEALGLQQTPKGRDTLERFFREWTGYEKVLGTTRMAAPNFDVVQKSMVQETQRFIQEVVFNTGGNVKDLMTAKYTFVDATLAPFYGFGAPGTGLAKVDRPANWGIGLLSQGSILAGTSHPTFTSPVFRGLLVYANLLCSPRPLPPPNGVPPIDQAMTATTTRERFEKSHAQAPCKGCHQQFEPFGFGLESFDETGRYRATEKTFPINAAATATLEGAGTLTFNGLSDLATQLAAMPRVTDCVSGLLTSYAFGGGGGQLCLAEEARTALANGTYGLRDFYAQLAKAPSFTRRTR